MWQSEEPWKNTHRNWIWALPAVNRINSLPLLFFDKCHESVHVASSRIASEFSICNVKNCWQGSDKETTGKPRVFTENRRLILLIFKSRSLFFNLQVNEFFTEKYLHNVNFGDINWQVIAPWSKVFPDWFKILASRTPRRCAEIKNKSMKNIVVDTQKKKHFSWNIQSIYKYSSSHQRVAAYLLVIIKNNTKDFDFLLSFFEESDSG